MQKGKHSHGKGELSELRGGGPKGHGLFGETSVVCCGQAESVGVGLRAVGLLGARQAGEEPFRQDLQTGPWQPAERLPGQSGVRNQPGEELPNHPGGAEGVV